MTGALLSIGAGFIFFIIALILLWQAWLTEEWSETSGQITASGVSEAVDWNSKHGTQTYYKARIVYVFDHKGKTYRATRIRRHDLRSTSESYIESLSQRYPVGTQVVVHYDPKNPYNAVLEQGAGWFEYFILIFSIAFIVGGLIYLLPHL